jgi:hypothetical protein
MQASENSMLSEHLCAIPYYWPKDIKLQNYQSGELFEVLSKVKLSQIVDLLKLISFR